MTVSTSLKNRLSTYAQNRSIYFSLGLDIRNANISMDEATEIITTMQTDPQFAYDFLIQREGVVLKVEKNLERSKRKVEKFGRLFNVTQKKKKDSIVKKKFPKNYQDRSISMNELLNHIINNISKYTTAITLQNICENFNVETNKNVDFNRMSSTLAGLTKKGLLQRISKGIYKPVENLSDQAQSHICHQEQPTPILATRRYDVGIERQLVTEFIRKNNTTGELVFTLQQLRDAYPNVDRIKLGKAVQNMRQNETNNLIKTDRLGEYKIIAPVDIEAIKSASMTSIPATTIAPAPVVTKIDRQEDIDNFIIDAVRLIRSVGFEKAQNLLVRANKIAAEI
jgi:hypothetical protein